MQTNYCGRLILFIVHLFNRNEARFYSKQTKHTSKSKTEEDPISLGKVFFDSRKAEIEKLKQNSDTHPYPNKFDNTCTILEYNQKYNRLAHGEVLEDVTERVAGRILSIRKAGSKLFFFDLQSDGAKLQVKVHEQTYERKEEFIAELTKFHRGDIIGVEGLPSRTKSGELSINSKTVSRNSVLDNVFFHDIIL